MKTQTSKLLVIIGILMIASAVAIGAVSTKITTVSFGLYGETTPRFTLYGIYDESVTEYSGNTYYLHLDNSSFDGWYIVDGITYNLTGNYYINNDNQIIGEWVINGYYSGWIKGKIGWL